MGEHAWLAKLGPQLGPGAPGVLHGIGDDAAVLAPRQGRLIWTVDASVEGVHFTRQIATPEDAGYRSFVAAASDVAAMGARPLYALSSLVVPGGNERETEALLDAIAAGQAAAAAAVGAPIVGGNVSSGPSIAITTTLLGELDEGAAPLLRSGARPGDGVWVAGALGRAAAGLRLLLSGNTEGDPPGLAECIRAFLRPRAQIELGPRLAGRASAAIDVSDGLAQDAAHLARASGCRLVLDAEAAEALGGAPLAAACAALSLDPAALALSGGEDYALLVTAAGSLADLGFALVGHVEPADQLDAQGQSSDAGQPEQLPVTVLRSGRPWKPPAGFDHLSRG
jgi:thiamine-monophosphate kinase